eukprot:NODE_18_length_40692_cov_0.469183.p18 type:complete len:149 gc:universal NODE_18_length_40692_cov_0.469183:12142-11696(-)
MFTCKCQIFTINSKNGAYSTQDFLDCVWEGHLQIENNYFELVNPYTRETYGRSMSILTSVKDSSRYFIVKLDQQGKQFFCGLGLLDRGDAMELQQRMSKITGTVNSAPLSSDLGKLSDLPTDFTLKSNIIIKKKDKGEEQPSKEWVTF